MSKNVLISPDKKAFYLANNVKVEGKEMRIRNPIVVGDRMVGLTDKREVCIGQLTPNVIEKPNIKLDMELMDEINRNGESGSAGTAPPALGVFSKTKDNKVMFF